MHRVRLERAKLPASVTLAETVYATLGVHEFCRSSEERVAGGTEVDVHFFNGGTGFHHVTAGTRNFRVSIVRMDFFFHFSTVLA